ncbi:MAG TPA: DUF58 domain-containing protein [Pirellulales bacterium]|jgi:uncharacterized protein (DUF58 family)|nr:DUF58 domain-containing protein [Pirellulales bacterium]
MTTVPPSGRFPDRLLDPQTLAKLQGLELRARLIVEGYVSGLHRSPYHGFSIEFAEHREYAPGDDLRYVDWKVFGKSDKFYLKQYEEETNLVSHLVLDTSESMGYQSDAAPLSKLEYAQSVAAALSYLILQQQDSVGLVTFDREIRALIRASSNPSHLRQLLHAMSQTRSERKTASGPIFHDLAERLKKRGVVVVLSDFFDDVPSMLAGLKHLRHRRHEVILFHVLDPAELDFPFRQPTLFKGLEGWPEVLADPRSLRKAYLAELDRFLHELRRGCRAHRIDYVQMRTDQPLDLALSSYLTARLAKT